VTSAFRPPPGIPTWLEEQLPFNRRVFDDGEHSIHFIDEGEGRPVLLQHGNPTWCYLWRKVIPILAENNVRVIAPDLVGLGLSSKPRKLATHTLDFHANRISSLIEALDLQHLTVAGQDWGGPIIAVAAARNPERIRAAVFANTAIRVPTKPPRVTAFHRFSHAPLISDLAFRVLNYPVKKMYLVQGDRSSIGPEERRAYRFPLRRFGDRTAPLALARLVPRDLESPVYDALREVQDWAQSFAGETRLVWGMKDPILGTSIYPTRKLFPDAEVVETDAGHFLQEEVPGVLAEAILRVAVG
jgi:haloalkane dehalogenase